MPTSFLAATRTAVPKPPHNRYNEHTVNHIHGNQPFRFSHRHLIAFRRHFSLPPRIGEHVLEHLDTLVRNIHPGPQERRLLEWRCEQRHRKAVQGVARVGWQKPVLPADPPHTAHDLVLLEDVEVHLTRSASLLELRPVEAVCRVVTCQHAIAPERLEQLTLIKSGEFFVLEAELGLVGPGQRALLLEGTPEGVVTEEAGNALGVERVQHFGEQGQKAWRRVRRPPAPVGFFWLEDVVEGEKQETCGEQVE